MLLKIDVRLFQLQRACQSGGTRVRNSPEANPILGPIMNDIVSNRDGRSGQKQTHIMVVQALRNRRISGVVGIIIDRAILLIGRIQRLHPKRASEDLISDLQSTKGVIVVEHLGGNGHSDREVGSELIV